MNIELEYFEAAFDWLRSQSSVSSKRLVLLEVHAARKLALELGARLFPPLRRWSVCSQLRVAPVGGLATVGTPAWRWCAATSSWQMPRPRFLRLAAELGKLALSRVFKVPYHETPCFEAELRDVRAVQGAAIPVERICGPVLLISGTDDQLWPSTMMCEMITERLKVRCHQYAYKHSQI